MRIHFKSVPTSGVLQTPPSIRSIRGQGYGTLPKDARLNLEGMSPHATMGMPASKKPPSSRPPLANTPTATLVVNPQPTQSASTLPGRHDGGGGLTQRPPLPGGATSRAADKPPTAVTNTPPSRKPRHFMSFGKGFFKAKSGRWSTSAPNLGEGPLFMFHACFLCIICFLHSRSDYTQVLSSVD